MPAKTVPTEATAGYVEFTFNGVTYKAKKKFKRLKFLRMLDEGKLFSAFSLAMDEEEYERLEDSDLDQDELEDLMEILAKTLLGDKADAKN